MKHELGIAGRLAHTILNPKLTPLFIAASLAIGVFAVMIIPREEEPVPMLVQLDRADRSSEQSLDNIHLLGSDGSMVPLRELVNVQHETIQPSIYHKNLRRVVYVTGGRCRGWKALFMQFSICRACHAA